VTWEVKRHHLSELQGERNLVLIRGITMPQWGILKIFLFLALFTKKNGVYFIYGEGIKGTYRNCEKE
jgi:hypothetical protein